MKQSDNIVKMNDAFKIKPSKEVVKKLISSQYLNTLIGVLNDKLRMNRGEKLFNSFQVQDTVDMMHRRCLAALVSEEDGTKESFNKNLMLLDSYVSPEKYEEFENYSQVSFTIKCEDCEIVILYRSFVPSNPRFKVSDELIIQTAEGAVLGQAKLTGELDLGELC